MFARADFGRLAGMLAGLHGRFIMSLNDRAEVRETFATFCLREVSTTYTIVRGRASGQGRTDELLIANFDLAGP